MPTTVVVTGAAGFVGGHVVELLLARGAGVVGIDREARPDHLDRCSGPAWLRADLAAGDDRVGDALAGADAVLHLAGCPGVRDAEPGVEHRRYRDNVGATAAVLAATRPRTPLVVTSSSSVYGGSASSRPCVETDPLAPRGGYARSKVAVERLCAARRAAGAAVLVARPFTVAGERQRRDMALARWIDAARADRPLRLLGSASRSRDVTDVAQVAAALVALVERADLRAGSTGAVNVGTGTAYTLGALADAVCAAVGRDVPRVLAPADVVEVPHTLADMTRLERLVGFVPHTDLAALVARQAAAQPVRTGTDDVADHVAHAAPEPVPA